jgi:hypothetical protein
LAVYCLWPALDVDTPPSFEAATYTFYLDGPGGLELDLCLPIQSITSIHDDSTRVYAAADLIDSGDYDVFGVEGLVILKDASTAGAFSTGRRALKVIGSFGYSAGNIPTAIQSACIEWVRHVWVDRKGLSGRSSTSRQGTTISTPTTVSAADWSVLAMPAHVKHMVAAHRRLGVNIA